MNWQQLVMNGLDTYVKEFTYNGAQIIDHHGKRIMVQVGAFRVDIYNSSRTRSKFIPLPDNLLLAMPDEHITAQSLRVHFAERDAIAIYARYEHCLTELTGDRKIWRIYEFPGRELVLARNIMCGTPLRPQWMAVVVHSNGVTLHAAPLVKKLPLDIGEMVTFIPSGVLTVGVLREYMPDTTAQEVIAVFRLNRRSLMRVIDCEALVSDSKSVKP